MFAGLDVRLAKELHGVLVAHPTVEGIRAAFTQLLEPSTRPSPEEVHELVEACDLASITLRSRRGRLTTVAASAPAAAEYDALQHEVGEGPSLETVLSAEVCRSNDVARDERWPRWGPRAADLGARSLVSVQLTSGGSHALGAINLYSHRINAWDEQAFDLALLFATHAAHRP